MHGPALYGAWIGGLIERARDVGRRVVSWLFVLLVVLGTGAAFKGAATGRLSRAEALLVVAAFGCVYAGVLLERLRAAWTDGDRDRIH